MRILVTGSREWTDSAFVRRVLELAPQPYSQHVLVHGDCPKGLDRMAANIASSLGMRVEAHPAQWSVHGRAAGPIRNQAMVDTRPDLTLAFMCDGSRGTADCVRRSQAAHIRTLVWTAPRFGTAREP